ncbi:MAG: 3-isopropylmalate dehydratase large subunit [Planctomycetes bacterium]|nr:3-isopropylmalate dehydratase large subunit [Planctomycetota bacterium]
MAGHTITEKIIAAHAGRDEVSAGDFVYANVDIALGNDITAPIAIREFEAAGVQDVFDRTRVVLVPDHFTPNKDIKSAEQSKILRDFARKHDLTHYWEVGEVGIEHALLPEQGVVGPGDLVIGADSHTCTYGALGAFSTGVGSTDLAAAMATGKVWLKVPAALKFVFSGKLDPWAGGKDLVLYTIGQIGVDGALYRSMEFCGPVIEVLGMDDRMSMCNMAIEAGGKNGIIAPDAVTRQYVDGRAEREPVYYASDADARYEKTYQWDVTGMGPMVACPNLPENVKAVGELKDVAVDQSVIGSCTNGRISDLRIAAKILKGKKVAKGCRCLVIPATQEIYLAAMREGLLETFVEAGCAVSTPTCGPCLGGHMGILAAGERAIATTNRNFTGRMGHPDSEVYLSNPAVAAASAVTGRITHPKDVG